MPEVAALSPEQAAQVKSVLTDQMKSAVFTFSPDTLTSNAAGVKKEEKYTVTRTEGDTLYTTDTAADGHVGHSQIDVAAKRLTITNSDKPSEVVVLVREDPPADGK
jgi:Tfp pilus assembly major pilin PilA